MLLLEDDEEPLQQDQDATEADILNAMYSSHSAEQRAAMVRELYRERDTMSSFRDTTASLLSKDELREINRQWSEQVDADTDDDDGSFEVLEGPEFVELKAEREKKTAAAADGNVDKQQWKENIEQQSDWPVDDFKDTDFEMHA